MYVTVCGKLKTLKCHSFGLLAFIYQSRVILKSRTPGGPQSGVSGAKDLLLPLSRATDPTSESDGGITP